MCYGLIVDSSSLLVIGLMSSGTSATTHDLAVIGSTSDQPNYFTYFGLDRQARLATPTPQAL